MTAGIARDPAAWSSCSGCSPSPRCCGCPNLATRGTWDADQGHDMLVLRAWVQDGIIPLLGPPTSIGDVHHGALYYYLLAPAAFLTGGDSPLAVVLTIALAGIAAVGVTWWLARSIGGPVAGFVAGLVLAVSSSAVDGSTFIWNPNLIALSSAVALAGAWRAWTTRAAALVARGGRGDRGDRPVPRPGHRDGPGHRWAADPRLAAAGRAQTGEPWLAAGIAWLVIVIASYVPLLVHELTNDFSEVQAALAYLRGGSDAAVAGPLERFPIVVVAGHQLAAVRPHHRGRRAGPDRGAARRGRSSCCAGARRTLASGWPCAGSASGCCGPASS